MYLCSRFLQDVVVGRDLTEHKLCFCIVSRCESNQNFWNDSRFGSRIVIKTTPKTCRFGKVAYLCSVFENPTPQMKVVFLQEAKDFINTLDADAKRKIYSDARFIESGEKDDRVFKKTKGHQKGCQYQEQVFQPIKPFHYGLHNS